MEICLYIISTHYGTNYCGITNNLRRRWKEHIKGQSKYLSIWKPKEVIYLEFYPNYTEARQRERQIKQIGVGKFFRYQWLCNLQLKTTI